MNKVLSVLAVSLVLVVSNAWAHCGKCGVGDAHEPNDMTAMVSEKTDKMAKKLNLSEEQKVKLQEILKKKMEKKQQIMDDKEKAMEALHEEFKTKLSTVLTPEQMKQWEENKEDKGDQKCPMCKKGKKCDMCKMKKNKGKDKHEGHDR